MSVLTVGHPVEVLQAPATLVASGVKKVCFGVKPPVPK